MSSHLISIAHLQFYKEHDSYPLPWYTLAAKLIRYRAAAIGSFYLTEKDCQSQGYQQFRYAGELLLIC